MNWFNELEKLKSRTGVFFILFDLLFLVSPGVAFIFFFDQTLFVSLDWIKLVLLSLAIITPLVMINTFLAVIFDQKENKTSPEKDIVFWTFFLGVSMSGFVIYVCLIISYFLKQGLENIAMYICFMEALGMVLAYIHDFRINKNKQKVI